jgi:alpha-glucuronidase
MRKLTIIILFLLAYQFAYTEDGYEVWLRYKMLDTDKVEYYKNFIKSIETQNKGETINVALKELQNGISKMTGNDIPVNNGSNKNCIILAVANNFNVSAYEIDTKSLGNDGYAIKTIDKDNNIVIVANKEIGLLYGAFHVLRLIQTQQSLSKIDIVEIPKIDHRLLNHWDNLDGIVERGYAGHSLWRWQELTEYIHPRYIDYARYNASIGINGTVLTNVNANSEILTPEYLIKVKALADAFRPYGVKVYLTARFSAPMELEGYETADPLNPKVIEWWNKKVKEIYSYIPDFGGFLVKANSEGQPGPREYDRSHAEGANLLANALKPYNGIVMWRAFVYSNEEPEDRAKQAYNEFMPLDGKFENNALVQIKNGPIDFQPREPFHPLFGAMKKTPVMMEFQITQEYLGQGLHLCYMASLYKENLDLDTYAKGKGSYVSKAIDGTLHNNSLSAIAGVANTGSDRNWTGHPFGQANWYSYGRLAWNHQLSAEEIAEEWIRMTFGNNEKSLSVIKEIMMSSYETEVNFNTPLGLHHQMAWHHHYGPGPWVDNKMRADWTSVYYHRASEDGIGFDRTKTGSDAVSQYFPELESKYGNIETCPEEYLLWFHHVPWDYKMKSGRTLWHELCYKYDLGVKQLEEIQQKWNSLEKYIDTERFVHVQSLLKIQYNTAKIWRGSCILYYQTFSKRPLPEWFEKPDKTLEEYMKIEFKYMPGSNFH